MPKSRRPYPPEFRRRMVELVCAGRSPEELGREFEPSAEARAQRDGELSERVVAIHARSRGTYGAPRVHAELTVQGERVGCKRVARLMRAAGLEGASRRRRIRTTKRSSSRRAFPDLVERNFTAGGPDRLWVADITYILTWAGFLYLAVVIDAWSRRVVGGRSPPTCGPSLCWRR